VRHLRKDLFLSWVTRSFFLPIRQSFTDIGSINSSVLGSDWRIHNFW
jgi:hypothetical protein